MEIALIAQDSKKELMAQFCIAYCEILSRHTLCASSITGKYVSDATGLTIERLLPGKQGGLEQIISRVAYNEIDMVLYFRDTVAEITTPDENETALELLRICDKQNVPIATNIATAEALVSALDRGDFDWREIINPNSEYNRRKNKKTF